MTFADYLLRLGTLVVALVPCCWAARRIRARLLDDRVDPLGWLADSVITLGLVLGVSQLLGAVGVFKLVPLAIALAGVGLALVAWAGRVPVRPSETTPQTASSDLEIGISVGAVGVTFAAWAASTVAALSNGITHYDSMWYHLPHAARFAQSGLVTRLHNTVAEFPDAFHPANSELTHAVGMVFFDADIASPVINLFWLGLGLVAAWCFGAAFGRPHTAITAVCVVFAAPFIAKESGSASNDAAAVALLLSAAALLVHPRRGPWMLVIAGVAAGLSISTKMTTLIAVAALTIGVITIERWRALWWLVPMLVWGSFWYVRNLVFSGSPQPALRLGVGPLSFPHATFGFIETNGGSVADYLFDLDAWRRYLWPGASDALGPLWAITIVLAVAGAIGAILSVRDGRVRTVAVAAAASGVGYIFTPLSATGPQGRPFLFGHAVVYAAPALVLGLVLLSTWTSKRRRSAIGVAVVLGAAVVLAQLSGSSIWLEPQRRRAILALVVFAGIAAVWFFVLPRLGSRRRVIASAVAVCSLLAIPASYVIVDRYLDRRYDQGPQPRYATVGGTRIALAGVELQYPLYDHALDTYVQYIGERGPHGAFRVVPDCSAWRTALRRGAFDRIVTSTERFDVASRELEWTRSDPAATQFWSEGRLRAFRFDPSVEDPGCADGKRK